MTTLAFVVPAYRRFDLTRVCLTQLARTCDDLAVDHGIQATVVVVGDDDNLAVARLLGFATVRRENRPLGRKFNDGIEYAARYLGCDYVVPVGTDNWVDARMVAQLPPDGTIAAHRSVTLVRESGDWMGQLEITYDGGDGIRTIPSAMLERLDFRPAEEDRERAIDTSIWARLGRFLGERPTFHYVDLHPLQIVGFQSVEEQLNTYAALRAKYGVGPERPDVWSSLAATYPQESVDAARDVFDRRRSWAVA